VKHRNKAPCFVFGLGLPRSGDPTPHRTLQSSPTTHVPSGAPPAHHCSLRRYSKTHYSGVAWPDEEGDSVALVLALGDFFHLLHGLAIPEDVSLSCCYSAVR
jgi:hypothetical protein